MKSRKLVYGVGINDTDYVVEKRETISYTDGKRTQKVVWACPFYRTWINMLTRCYSASYQISNPSYKDCSVSKEWLTFSNFKSWMETQDFEGVQLDKDILFNGNRVYSKETCVFVSGTVNTFTNDSRAARGEWLIGVCWSKRKGKFQSRCRNPFTKSNDYLGYFTCEQEAHNAWLKRKLELAHLLAAEQSDPRVVKALIERYSKPQK